MEPNLNTPNNAPGAREYKLPELPINPEQTIEVSRESAQPTPENASQSGAVHGVVPIINQPVAPPQHPGSATPVVNPAVDDTPVVASDADLIEKEWVDKAKSIVNSTKEDPYMQEREVSKLQADYLRKRYGKDIKLASD